MNDPEYQPPNGADPTTSSKDGDAPNVSEDTSDPPPESDSGTDSRKREDDAEPEPTSPKDWEPLAVFTEADILRRLALHATIEDSNNRQGWLHRMEQVPLIRALYSKMRGTRFEKPGGAT